MRFNQARDKNVSACRLRIRCQPPKQEERFKIDCLSSRKDLFFSFTFFSLQYFRNVYSISLIYCFSHYNNILVYSNCKNKILLRSFRTLNNLICLFYLRIIFITNKNINILKDNGFSSMFSRDVTISVLRTA